MQIDTEILIPPIPEPYATPHSPTNTLPPLPPPVDYHTDQFGLVWSKWKGTTVLGWERAMKNFCPPLTCLPGTLSLLVLTLERLRFQNYTWSLNWTVIFTCSETLCSAGGTICDYHVRIYLKGNCQQHKQFMWIKIPDTGARWIKVYMVCIRWVLYYCVSLY